MKFGVVIFPGSNCDRDLIHVLENVVEAEVKVLWHKDKSLDGLSTGDCVMLPGGFSYGDYLRSGAIARFSPIMQSVIEFANNGGMVMGICNGFQILCEAGLLPGALVRNRTQRFACKNVFIIPQTKKSRLTADLDLSQPLKIPIAHGEGSFFADPATLKKLNDNNQVLFRYCSEKGVIDDASNPNGALENIAGICNEKRNVFGMMPHPERASEQALNNTDGLLLFKSLVAKSLSVA